MIALSAGVEETGGVRQVFQPVNLQGEPIALLRRKKAARVVIELRAQFFTSHRVLGRASVVFFHFFERPPVFQDDPGSALETAGAGISRIDIIVDAARQREDLRILKALSAVADLPSAP